MPAAVLASILFHAGLFVLAGALVIFTITKPKEVVFEAPPPVKVPKMPLKKLQVKMKKPSKPKASAKITAVVNRPDLHDIQFPDLASSGIGAGLGGGGEVVKFNNMPIYDEPPGLFGENINIGNNLIGTFYDLKRRRGGGSIVLTREGFMAAVGKFTRGGWKATDLARYYRAPKKLYATSLMIPPIYSVFAPAEFNEPDVQGLQWIVHYKGQLVYPKAIKFRFRGHGDDIMVVRVGGKVVLNASWGSNAHYYSDWSPKGVSGVDYMGNSEAVVGDWITLKPYTPVDMEVVIGEEPGGLFCSMLVVEVEGEKYEMNKFGASIYPIFKTAEPTRAFLDAIYYTLLPGEAALTGGPVFCDYSEMEGEEGSADTEGLAAEKEPEDLIVAEVEKKPKAETGLRTWTSPDGKTFEGKYVMVMGGKVVLLDAKGKQRRIPKDAFSEADRRFIELEYPPEFKIEFARKSKQYNWPIKREAFGLDILPGVLDYVFTAKVKQTSSGFYPHKLQVEFFAIGEEMDGDNYILLDRQESSFIPSEQENGEYYTLSGRTVRLYDYEFYRDGRRGQQYGGYLVVVTDSRGKIIAHKSSYNWMFEAREALKKLPLNSHVDKTCSRVFPPRPKVGFQNDYR